MKKFLILLLLASPVQADMRHSITTSAKIQVDAAYSSAERIGTTYSITIVDTDFTITTAGSAVSLTESLVVGDAVQSATTVTGGVVPALPSLGVVVTGSGGVSGGTITSLSSGVHTCAGTMGAGSSCTAQTIVESVVD